MTSPTQTKHILIVEDDDAIATGLSLNLKLEGFSSEIVEDGDSVGPALARKPALVLLDINMPRKDGLEVLREMREAGDRTPVIVLSAREGEYDKVAALRLGADDYVTKPFALAELIARIDAVLRRAETQPPSTATSFGDVVVDMRTRTVTKSGTVVKLTHLEFELLTYLMKRPQEVLSRETIFNDVWDMTSKGSKRTVDNFVAQLRAKLENDPEHPRHLTTVRGSGYRFDP